MGERREQVLAGAALWGEDGAVLLKCSLKNSPSLQPEDIVTGSTGTLLRRQHVLGESKAAQRNRAGVDVLPSLFIPSANKYLPNLSA